MRRKRRISKKFSRRMQKKLLIVFGGVTFCLVILIGRLMYIEYHSGEKYEKIVLSQQHYDSRIIPYQRGDIVDAKVTVLATSIDVYNVILDCKVLNEHEEDIEATVSALATCFSDLNKDDLFRQLKENKDSQYTVLLKKLSYDTIQPFVEMQSDSEKYPNINSDAVWFEKEYIRTYPYNSLASSVIGFVSGGNVGTVGLENYYNSTLNGVNGRQYGYLNSDNNLEKTIKDAKDGNTIVTTIDVNIQSVVEEKLAKFNEEYTNGFREGDGSKHIAALVMNPQNGEIYAMGNYPNFDLNNPRDLSSYYSEEELAGYSEEEKMDLLNKVWENFCITYTFEPGSTAKPFTVSCGLDTGTLRGDETYVCDGSETIAGQQVHCVSRMGHGIETIESSLMDSCNDALMQMSYAIGVDNFSKYQSLFGFGQKTGVDLPGEATGILFSKDKMTALDLATNSFGQNFNCTMIQLASAYSSLVNGGNYYQPHVVKKILDSEGNIIETIQPILLKETASEETSEMLKSYMYATVSEGTAATAKVNGYSMGGKTGTAQKLPRAERNYLVSFIGYVPQENPEVVVYVIIDEPNVEEQAHSSYAQTVAKEILEEILPYLNIYPDEEMVDEPEQEGQEAGAETISGEQSAEDDVPQEELTAEGETSPEGAVAGEVQSQEEVTVPEENTPEELPADVFNE